MERQLTEHKEHHFSVYFLWHKIDIQKYGLIKEGGKSLKGEVNILYVQATEYRGSFCLFVCLFCF